MRRAGHDRGFLHLLPGGTMITSIYNLGICHTDPFWQGLLFRVVLLRYRNICIQTYSFSYLDFLGMLLLLRGTLKIMMPFTIGHWYFRSEQLSHFDIQIFSWPGFYYFLVNFFLLEYLAWMLSTFIGLLVEGVKVHY